MSRRRSALVTGSAGGVGLHFIADLTVPYGRVIHDYLSS